MASAPSRSCCGRPWDRASSASVLLGTERCSETGTGFALTAGYFHVFSCYRCSFIQVPELSVLWIIYTTPLFARMIEFIFKVIEFFRNHTAVFSPQSVTCSPWFLLPCRSGPVPGHCPLSRQNATAFTCRVQV